MAAPGKAGFFQELKQRSVVRVAAMYLVSGWVILQLAEVTFPIFELSLGAYRLVLWLLVLGFPITVALAWTFDFTAQGIVRTSTAATDTAELAKLRSYRRFDLLVIALLVVALTITWWPRTTSEVPVAELSRSIAVLPFDNLSTDPENAHFADGMAEEILNVLAKIPDLKVAARTASFRYRDSDQDLAQIGSELNVDHALEGSVRRADNTLRVTVQLVRTDNGYHLWSETYEAPIDNIFTIQDEISRSVARALRSTLHREILNASARNRTDNLEAYNEYLLALHYRADNWIRSVDHAKRALELDPDYLSALGLLAFGYVTRVGGSMPADKAFPLAREIVTRAMAIDPEAPEVLVPLGHIARREFRYADAESAYRNAQSRNPAMGTADLANILLATGRVQEALVEFRHAKDLDPIGAGTKYIIALITAGQIDLARREQARRTDNYAQLESNTLALMNDTLIYAAIGDWEQAETTADSMVAHAESFVTLAQGYAAYIYGRVGRTDEARAIINALERRSATSYVSPTALFWAYLGTDDLDKTFEWLDRVVEEYAFIVILGLKTYPWFDPIRDDPRFAAALTKAGL
jgi:TolB-like protein/Flp pilus assembly protein TadD